jgi:hypothetical protein
VCVFCNYEIAAFDAEVGAADDRSPHSPGSISLCISLGGSLVYGVAAGQSCLRRARDQCAAGDFLRPAQIDSSIYPEQAALVFSRGG